MDKNLLYAKWVSTDNFKLKCENGNNSPLDRPEFVDINVSENPGKKEK